MKFRLLALASLFFFVTSARSESVSSPHSNITYTYNTGTKLFSWTAWSVSGTFSGSSGGNGLVYIDRNSSTVFQRIYGSSSNGTVSNTGSTSGAGLYGPGSVGVNIGSFTAAAGDVILIRAGFYNPSTGNTYTGSATITVPADEQTVTVTPALHGMALGSEVTLTASGGQNGYVWTAGTGGGVITGSGPTVTFSATAPGSYSVGVYSPAGGGYAESNVADAIINVSEEEAHFIHVNETNTTSATIVYRLTWKGTEIVTFELAPGQSFRARYEVSDATPGILEWRYKGITRDDGTGIWTKTDETDPWRPGVNIVPDTAPSDTPYVPPTTKTTSLTETEQQEAPNQDTKPGRGVWTSINSTNINNSVTAGQNAEGIEKIVGKLDELQETMEGTPQDASSFPSEGGEGSSLPSSAEAGAIASAIEGMIPTAVTLPTSVGQDGVWAITVPCPYIDEISFSMDLTRWAGPVAAFRGMLLACEVIVFFYVAVSVIRSAFAS